MQNIALEVAGPEMVVAKPVTREDGVVLVAAGAVLTPALISRLDAMGVGEVVVEGDALDTGAGGGAEALAGKVEHLEYLFRNFKDNPYMQQVKGVVRDYFAQKCALAAAVQSRRDGDT